jgi:uncharacterized membrane-anchored protein
LGLVFAGFSVVVGSLQVFFLFLYPFCVCVILYISCMLRGAYAFYKISLITYKKRKEKGKKKEKKKKLALFLLSISGL